MLINTGNQYKDDIFNKLAFDFKKGRRILDVGCGDGSDARIFIENFGLEVCAIDVYEDKGIKDIAGLEFRKASISRVPYEDSNFDYVFLHDVLHHIDRSKSRHERASEALRELGRVCKKGGYIIIVEGNRYNPFFYPHMVLMHKHHHLRQSYFKKLIKQEFDAIEFKFFEAHVYPLRSIKIFKIYEKIMETVPYLKPFLAYNVAIIKNVK